MRACCHRKKGGHMRIIRGGFVDISMHVNLRHNPERVNAASA